MNLFNGSRAFIALYFFMKRVVFLWVLFSLYYFLIAISGGLSFSFYRKYKKEHSANFFSKVIKNILLNIFAYCVLETDCENTISSSVALRLLERIYRWKGSLFMDKRAKEK